MNKAFVNRHGAYFSDSSSAVLYFVPISPAGELGPASTSPVTGPAAEISGEFNLNGIVAPDAGAPLIVSHTANGRLYTVDPTTGASRTIDGVDVPKADGLALEGRHLWVVQNWINQVSRVRLKDDLAVINAKADTGIHPTADEYEVVIAGR
ncbi:hypothetical protein [Streptosporangium nondiastaticum]|uniref:hypothetical protein n=1 Tax=Streptosporangium nondiastaticum TaxID=35764 RepID=UPI001CB94D4A|nr:hypothetical protein [Streptosporangium nondiastaticum]